MYRKLLIFFILFKISAINAADLPVVDGRCACYKMGLRESHVSELDRRWRRLQNDPTMYSYLPRTEAEDLFDYWNDYKAYYFAASDLYKSLNNTVRSLKPQFSSYYYPRILKDSSKDYSLQSKQKKSGSYSIWNMCINGGYVRAVSKQVVTTASTKMP